MFLKHFFYIFLYLNIYIAFSAAIGAQELHLSVQAEKDISKQLLDSLRFETTFKDYLSLKRHVDTLTYYLERVGYIESKLASLEKENDSSYLATLFLGNRYRHVKIYYSEEDFSEDELIRVSSEIKQDHFIVPFEAVEISLQKLNALKTENGNAFARLRLNEISKEDEQTLTMHLILEGGAVRTIDSIIVRGYEKFPSSFLKYYAGIKTGTIFNQKELVEKTEVVSSLQFVKSIKPPEALFKKDTTTVYLYIEKVNNNLFDGILGFATNEETQNIEFNGFLNLELNNNLNFGEQFLINYKADGNEQQNFRVKASLPYLFKSPIGLGLELKIFKRDSSFVTTEQEARITYQLNPTATAYVGYKGYESSNLLNEALAGIAIEDYKSAFIIAGASYNKSQNNPLFPIKSYAGLTGELGNREQSNRKESQFRISGKVHHIFNLNARNSIYVQNETSFFSSDTYLTNELFRFGGINSIRGFNENSIDASLFSVLNTEYRYQISTGLYLHSIIDLGYFENQTIPLKEKLYSFGIGLGLQTKAGIFKFNIANGNSENQNFNFSNTKIHISLSTRF